MVKYEIETNIYGLKAGDSVWFYSIKTVHDKEGKPTFEFTETQYEVEILHSNNNREFLRTVNPENKKTREIKFKEGMVFRNTIWLKEPNRDKALELLQKDAANSRDDAKKIVDMYDKKILYLHHLMHYKDK